VTVSLERALVPVARVVCLAPAFAVEAVDLDAVVAARAVEPAPRLAVLAVLAVDLRAVVAVALAAGVVFLAAGFLAAGLEAVGLEAVEDLGARLAGGMLTPVAASRVVAGEATRSARRV
jgi:hypothetical protein